MGSYAICHGPYPRHSTLTALNLGREGCFIISFLYGMVAVMRSTGTVDKAQIRTKITMEPNGILCDRNALQYGLTSRRAMRSTEVNIMDGSYMIHNSKLCNLLLWAFTPRNEAKLFCIILPSPSDCRQSFLPWYPLCLSKSVSFHLTPLTVKSWRISLSLSSSRHFSPTSTTTYSFSLPLIW